jgi:leucyl aminopeptidase
MKGILMAKRGSGAPPTVAIKVEEGDVTQVAVDALILAVPSKGDWDGPLAAVDAAMNGALRQAVDDSTFSGNVGATLVVPTLGLLPAKRIVLTGIPSGETTADKVRKAYGTAGRVARGAGAQTVATPPPAGGLPVTAGYRAAVEGGLLGLYTFVDYKSDASDDDPDIDQWTRSARASPRAMRWLPAATSPVTW